MKFPRHTQRSHSTLKSILHLLHRTLGNWNTLLGITPHREIRANYRRSHSWLLASRHPGREGTVPVVPCLLRYSKVFLEHSYFFCFTHTRESRMPYLVLYRPKQSTIVNPPTVSKNYRRIGNLVPAGSRNRRQRAWRAELRCGVSYKGSNRASEFNRAM